jgi:hypothetical protein
MPVRGSVFPASVWFAMFASVKEGEGSERKE